MNHRSIANDAAGKVIPGMMILLLYYCVYSLSGDILAADRQRGFLSKLTLTPISTGALLGGKAMAVVSIGFLTSAFTILILILSSWANRSNSPLSLLPFGLFLFPTQLVMIFASILVAAMLMVAYCFKVIMDLNKMQDILMNLQMPLLLFLIDFFLQLFRNPSPVPGEYFIPLHNNMIIIRDILDGSLQTGRFGFVMVLNLILVFILFQSVHKSFSAAPIDIEAPRRQK
jgi:ABC-type Na+ efflux pump permease subunit